MIEILKKNLRKSANFIGSLSFGALFLKNGIRFGKLEIFLYFLAMLGICFFIYKSLKAGFENSIIEVLFLIFIYLIKIDPKLKSFLNGAFLFISITLILNRVKDAGKNKDLVTAVLYVLIAVVIGILYFYYPTSLRDMRDVYKINSSMWFLFGLICLIGNI
ncbi:phosphatidate cytidylyltransferase [Leptotrichia alba]|uniref:Phosphatidate cytidylyltransferase n=1 Tax=Leptotrichia alba TaxID=3239304 RepID=A0AB39V4N4_9FUSO